MAFLIGAVFAIAAGALGGTLLRAGKYAPGHEAEEGAGVPAPAESA